MSQGTTERDALADFEVIGNLIFRTPKGVALAGDALDTLAHLPPRSVQLLVSSPPFGGPSPMGADDFSASDCTDWLLALLQAASRAMQSEGSIVLEVGTTWMDDRPVRNLSPFHFLSALCQAGEWRLLQEFYWYNPRFLTSPKRLTGQHPIRFRDCVTLILWLSKVDSTWVNEMVIRGHSCSLTGQGGNFVMFEDGAADVKYLDRCTETGADPHAERFPESFPSFFVELLTKPGDFVLDPFAGSCATGAAAERLGRSWVCVDSSAKQLQTGKLRFHDLCASIPRLGQTYGKWEES